MSGRGDGLTHLGPDQRPRMVDVSDKGETSRRAVAIGAISMKETTLAALTEQAHSPKGDVLRVAEVAGIQGGKRTGELIPLCHILPAVSLEVDLTPDPELPGIRARATARIRGSTGVEMEALTAVSISLLTAYDMLKSRDRTMEIHGVRLVEKEGGRSGDWTAETEEEGHGGRDD